MKRKNKSICILFVIVVVLCISVGYAVLNSTLVINGKSNVSKNTWSVHFENIKITDGSVTASVEPAISNNTTISNFEIKLDKPGDFYEFYVDVKNSGTIDAMINSVVKTPDLTDNQKKYIDYIVKYQNGEEITTKHLVKANEYVRIKVKVEYKKDLTSSDLPTVAETLTLGLDINYIQAEDTGVTVPGRSFTKIVSGDGTKTGDEICIGEECFYVMYSDEDTVTMFSKYNLYVGGEYDSTWTVYGDEATGKQDPNMLGYDKNQTARKGVTSFSSINYWSSTVSNYPAYVYDSNSLLYNYVENYKSYLSTLGVTPSDARLITYDELTALGCSGNSCRNALSWVLSTSYWTGTVYSSNNVWRVYSDGTLTNYNFSASYHCGCRPVIIIPKNEIVIDNSEKKIIEFTIGDVTYQAEEGMTWEEWTNSDYNTCGLVIDGTGLMISASDGGRLKNDTGNSVSISDTILENGSYYVTWMSDIV